MSIAVTSDFKLLSEKDKILKVVEERITKYPDMKALKYGELAGGKFAVEIPRGSPLLDAIGTESTCYLLVPEDLQDEASKKTKKLIEIFGSGLEINLRQER